MNKNKVKELAEENEGVLEKVKNSGKKKPVSLQQLLSIILNRELTREEAKMFIDHHFKGINKVDWLTMSHLEIYDLALKAVDFKKMNQEKWRLEKIQRQLQKQKQEKMKKEEQKLKREMIRRNMNKQMMAKMVKESIKNCRQIMMSCKNDKEYERLKETVADLELQLNILQGSLMEDVEVVIKENEEIDPQVLIQINEMKEKKRKEMALKEIERINRQRIEMELRQKHLNQIKRKLNVIFEYYGKVASDKRDTFSGKELISKEMDMKCFLLFIKQFEILNSSLTIYQIVPAFKKLSKNNIWLDRRSFQQLVFYLYHLQGLKLQDKPGDAQLIEYMNIHITNDQKMRSILHLVNKRKINEFEFYPHSGKIKQDIIEEIRKRRETLNLKKDQIRNRSTILLDEKRRNSLQFKSNKKFISREEVPKTQDTMTKRKKIYKSEQHLKKPAETVKQIKQKQPDDKQLLNLIGYREEEQDDFMLKLRTKKPNQSEFSDKKKRTIFPPITISH